MSRAERDAAYMRLALAEAERGRGTTAPNPMVGCIVVAGNEIVGRGFHERAGEPHAEVFALREAGDRARGAEVFVTLEPCSHHGRTPPCADALVDAGVGRVVAAMIDPNPKVSGRGIVRLREAGIEVSVGVCGAEAARLNEGFVTVVTRGRPFVTLKLAMSLDGRIAARGGVSQWISGEAARRRVQVWRSEHDGVLVGTGTLLCDDPRLTVRDLPVRRQPRRFVLDRCLRAPARRVFDVSEAPTTVFCGGEAPDARRRELEALGVEVVELPAVPGGLDLRAALASMVPHGVMTLLVEGGGEVAGALRDADLIDRCRFFVAPMLLGGRDASAAVAGLGAASPQSATRFSSWRVEQVEGDLLIEADLR
jgi:diaminohydroxyphosphoribosylaminopyrimidine deaminase/5-amino-6-(5-phosphoribosylamino)uracil reductase